MPSRERPATGARTDGDEERYEGFVNVTPITQSGRNAAILASHGRAAMAAAAAIHRPNYHGNSYASQYKMMRHNSTVR
jgi:hypothetical protein